jgi:hypothetical protein
MLHTFGKVVRAGIRFGLVQIAVLLGVFALFLVGMFLAIGAGRMLAGIPFMAAGLLLAIASAVVFGTLYTILDAVLYRYAVGLPTPGVDVEMIASSLKVKE